MPSRLAVHRAIVLLVLAFASMAAQAERTYYARQSASKAFVDVVLDLKQSVGRHNFAVVGHNEIGRAIRRRGRADFADAAIVHFCNLEYARRVLSIDRSLILYLPCRIAVYQEGDTVHAASLMLPRDTPFDAFNQLANEINTNIREIVDDAIAPVIPPQSGS